MNHLLLTTIAAVLLVFLGESKESPLSVEVKKIEQMPEKSGVSIMTFNTEWLLGSQTQVEALKKKGIWGLENKDTESEIEQQHQSVATIVARHAPDILCLQEVINEVAAKRLQKALQGKGLQYALHFLESRDTYLEQDVVFLTNKSSGNITNIKASHPMRMMLYVSPTPAQEEFTFVPVTDTIPEGSMEQSQEFILIKIYLVMY